MVRYAFAAAAALLAAGCSSDSTPSGLVRNAERAVESKLGDQGDLEFSEVKPAVSSGIACGHVLVRKDGRVVNEQDFVYRQHAAIMDDDSGYSAAAIQCFEDLSGDNGADNGS